MHIAKDDIQEISDEDLEVEDFKEDKWISEIYETYLEDFSVEDLDEEEEVHRKVMILLCNLRLVSKKHIMGCRKIFRIKEWFLQKELRGKPVRPVRDVE